MEKKKILAYEFRNKKKLMYFINVLGLKYNINTESIVTNPVFDKTSEDTPVYIITEEDSHQYTISDTVSGGIEIINEESD